VSRTEVPRRKISNEMLEQTILELVEHRGAGKTICPSEVARALGGPQPEAWGRLMQPVRHAAIRLARQDRLSILRKGRVVDPGDFKGVYRLGAPQASQGAEDEPGDGEGKIASV
jgi:hypothetical protein